MLKQNITKIDPIRLRLLKIKKQKIEVSLKLNYLKHFRENHTIYNEYKTNILKELSVTNSLIKRDYEKKKDLVNSEIKLRKESQRRFLVEKESRLKERNESHKTSKMLNKLMIEEYKAHDYNEKKCRYLNKKMQEINYKTNLILKNKQNLSKIHAKNLKKIETNKSEIINLKKIINTLEQQESKLKENLMVRKLTTTENNDSSYSKILKTKYKNKTMEGNSQYQSISCRNIKSNKRNNNIKSNKQDIYFKTNIKSNNRSNNRFGTDEKSNEKIIGYYYNTEDRIKGNIIGNEKKNRTYIKIIRKSKKYKKK